MNPFMHKFDDVTRRAFVGRAAQTFLGVSALSLAGGTTRAFGGTPFKPAKNVIYIYLNGGMSHLDTFDPKEDSEIKGETEILKTSADGVRVSHFLPQTAKVMDRVCVFNAMNSKQGAHERGQYFVRTSYNPLATIRHPGLGAWVLKLGGKISDTLPGNVVINGDSRHPGAGFMESNFSPLTIGDPDAGLQNSTMARGVTEEQFQRRIALSDNFDRVFRARYPHKDVKAYTNFYQDALKLMKSEDLKAFDLAEEKQETRNRYGDSNFGQGLLLARRLVQNGVRFVEVGNGGWDTHADNWERLADKCADLDTGFSALIEDLTATGLINETIVVLATEFGRTPKINDRTGRDHHPRVFTCLMAGGPVKGGQAYGKSDSKGYAVEENMVEPPQFNATIAHALGLEVEKVVHAPNGRPFTMSNKAQPVTAIF